ncbi:MAG: GerW family sporulation protein [Dethiobacteria bacterium]|jgi:sporulation protein YtfJ|nr:sporulation protein YtfJ [Bacillota bacterium]
MDEHPIQSLMTTAMENLKEMVDVNKIVGDAVETPDGSVIIPVSRVTFGFAAGGSEFQGGEGVQSSSNQKAMLPFGGGSGGGVTVQPVAFLVVGGGQVRLLPVDGQIMFDRIFDVAPQLITQIQELFKQKRKESPVAYE